MVLSSAWIGLNLSKMASNGGKEETQSVLTNGDGVHSPPCGSTERLQTPRAPEGTQTHGQELSLPKTLAEYRQWVCKNPELARRVEEFGRAASFLVPVSAVFCFIHVGLHIFLPQTAGEIGFENDVTGFIYY